jgi:hypothetical protein
MKKKRTAYRWIFIILCSITLLFILLVLAVSPYVKYILEKEDIKLINREIRIGWSYANIFTGYVYLSDVTIYEPGKDTAFVKAESVSGYLDLRELLKHNFHIREFTFNQPVINVLQNRKDYNFKDLTERKDRKKSHPGRFKVLDLKINNGTLYYTERAASINYFVHNLNVSSSTRLDRDTLAFLYSFDSGPGSGNIKGYCGFKPGDKTYDLHIISGHYTLELLEEYLHDITGKGNLDAVMDADMHITGSLTDKLAMNAKGFIGISNLHFGETKEKEIASLDSFLISFRELKPRDNLRFIDSIIVRKPFIKYEKYDQQDNWTRLLGVHSEKMNKARADSTKFNLLLEVVDYIHDMVLDFFESNFKVDRFRVAKGSLLYNDYSLVKKFSLGASEVSITGDSIEKTRRTVDLKMNCMIRPYGSLQAFLKVNSKDKKDMDLVYHLQDISAAAFNPLIIEATSYPLDRGSVSGHGKWMIRDNIIQSENHLRIFEPHSDKRVNDPKVKHKPLPLLLFFLNERGNTIDYELPITGDLKKPDYHPALIMTGLLRSLLVNTPNPQYSMEVSYTEPPPVKFHAIQFDFNDAMPAGDQSAFMKELNHALKDDHDLKISITPFEFRSSEFENALFFEAKKLYYLDLKGKPESGFDLNDSIFVEGLSVKDPLFMQYLEKHAPSSLYPTRQEACLLLTGESRINNKLEDLRNARRKNFLDLFDEDLRTRISFAPIESGIPFNGFSEYRVSYNKNIPDSLTEEYQKLADKNEKKHKRRERRDNEKEDK